ncbi:hypothetical protein MCA1823 [Methylococcus capsulatus str. Bath]|uniref:Uncharacterized protein n=1 Tax=Methylococcus capsulatus (strain ATCC 33009 / NCIMB 11132 / Bath) TaxID=243233 RepID=Q607D7_METCA|nr:hypothetical protein MCA1823 [Methylococcus capsulatus str. Bath]
MTTGLDKNDTHDDRQKKTDPLRTSRHFPDLGRFCRRTDARGADRIRRPPARTFPACPDHLLFEGVRTRSSGSPAQGGLDQHDHVHHRADLGHPETGAESRPQNRRRQDLVSRSARCAPRLVARPGLVQENRVRGRRRGGAGRPRDDPLMRPNRSVRTGPASRGN